MIVAIAGTGTHVGKTTFSVAWIRDLRRRGLAVRGWKPVETGGDADARALGEAAGEFRAPAHALAEPISAHLAARRAGVRIDLAAIAAEAHRIAEQCDLLVVETAGGLFSPVTDHDTNAELVESLDPDRLILVAPDRLGTLHDVEAVRRACTRQIDLVVLTGAHPPDAGTTYNADELRQPCVRMPDRELPAEAAARLAALVPRPR